MTVRTAQAASAEFVEAVRWYETQRPGLGGEFFDAVTATLSLIESAPQAGTPIAPDTRTRRALVTRFPYQVVYRIRPAEIVVVAIAHMKRRPDYWIHRN